MTTLRQSLAVIKSYGDQIPVPVEDIIRQLGLGPHREPMPDDVSGKIVRAPTDAGYTIVVNSRHHSNRQRFTMAHELGHYIFHRDLLNMGVGDTLAYRWLGSGTPNDRIGPTQETEANRFAANLLMPNSAIVRLQAVGVTDPAAMAKRLGVSEGAMRIKLGLPPKTELFG